MALGGFKAFGNAGKDAVTQGGGALFTGATNVAKIPVAIANIGAYVAAGVTRVGTGIVKTPVLREIAALVAVVVAYKGIKNVVSSRKEAAEDKQHAATLNAIASSSRGRSNPFGEITAEEMAAYNAAKSNPMAVGQHTGAALGTGVQPQVIAR